jgi:hypothetical protein
MITGQVDGSTLLTLYRDSNAAALFTAPVPEGFGFNTLLFRGRFKKEMDNLLLQDSNILPHLPRLLPCDMPSQHETTE